MNLIKEDGTGFLQTMAPAHIKIFSIEQAQDVVHIAACKQELGLIALETEKLLSHSASIKIDDEETAKEALTCALLARNWLKRVDLNRKEVIKPESEFIKAFNSAVKEVAAKLEDIEAEISLRVHYWMEDNAIDTLDCEVGKMDKKIVYTFQLDSIECVPAEYLMLDEKKVKEAIKNGVRRIPGVTILKGKEMSMRLKSDI